MTKTSVAEAAQAIVEWLESQGIDPATVTLEGFGPEGYTTFREGPLGKVREHHAWKDGQWDGEISGLYEEYVGQALIRDIYSGKVKLQVSSVRKEGK